MMYDEYMGGQQKDAPIITLAAPDNQPTQDASTTIETKAPSPIITSTESPYIPTTSLTVEEQPQEKQEDVADNANVL